MLFISTYIGDKNYIEKSYNYLYLSKSKKNLQLIISFKNLVLKTQLSCQKYIKR